MPSDYFGDFRFPIAGTQGDTNFTWRTPNCSPLEDCSASRELDCGSAHVSVELKEEQLQHADTVVIQADCTDPPWVDQEMLYCGRTSTSKHLYTMLYDNIPTRPVRFQMRAGDQAVTEPTFYEQLMERDGSISNVVEPWTVLESGMLTPTESERPPLLPHEQTLGPSPCSSASSEASDVESKASTMRVSEPWRRHRRQPSVVIELPSPLGSTGTGRLASIVEESENSTVDDKPKEGLSRKDHRKDSSMELL